MYLSDFDELYMKKKIEFFRFTRCCCSLVFSCSKPNIILFKLCFYSFCVVFVTFLFLKICTHVGDIKNTQLSLELFEYKKINKNKSRNKIKSQQKRKITNLICDENCFSGKIIIISWIVYRNSFFILITMMKIKDWFKTSK